MSGPCGCTPWKRGGVICDCQPEAIIDDFSTAQASGWGGSWALVGSGAAVSVSNGNGVVDYESGGGTGTRSLFASKLFGGWLSAYKFSITIRFSFTNDLSNPPHGPFPADPVGSEKWVSAWEVRLYPVDATTGEPVPGSDLHAFLGLTGSAGDPSGGFSRIEAGGAGGGESAVSTLLPSPLSFNTPYDLTLAIDKTVRTVKAVVASGSTVISQSVSTYSSALDGARLTGLQLRVGGPGANPYYGVVGRVDQVSYVICDCPDDEPSANQAVEDEFVDLGDGGQTQFYTDWPYSPLSLEPEVNGYQVGFDTTNPATGEFAIVPAPGVGARVSITYRRAV